MRVGEKQTIRMLINEKALLFVKCIKKKEGSGIQKRNSIVRKYASTQVQLSKWINLSSKEDWAGLKSGGRERQVACDLQPGKRK